VCGREEKRMGWGEKEREKRKNDEDLGGEEKKLQRKKEEGCVYLF